VRLSDDVDGVVGAIERRNDGREAIAVVVRDRHDDARIDAIHHRARDVANEVAVADSGSTPGAIDDDRVT